MASFAASLTSSADVSVSSITTALGTPARPPLAGKMAVCTANLRAEPVSMESSQTVCICVFSIAAKKKFSEYCTYCRSSAGAGPARYSLHQTEELRLALFVLPGELHVVGVAVLDGTNKSASWACECKWRLE